MNGKTLEKTMPKTARIYGIYLKSIKRATRVLRHYVQIVPENHPTQSLAFAGSGKTL